MSTNQTIINYMKSENYGVIYIPEHRVFKIVDRNGEIASSKSFNIAAEAIDYAFDEYKTLTGE